MVRPLLVLAALLAPAAAHAAPQVAPDPGEPDGGPPVGGPDVPDHPLDPRSPFSPSSPWNSGNPGSGPEDPGIGSQALWTTWWALHRDLYLDLRSRARAGGPGSGDGGFFLGRGERATSPGTGTAPTPERLRADVLPALHELLEGDPPAEVARTALLALARAADALDGPAGDRAGEDSARAAAARVLRAHVASKERAIGEIAVLALGLVGRDHEATALVGLLRDTEAGRALAGGRPRDTVPLRHRAFAGYALGLLGERAAREDVRRYAVHHLVAALDEDLSATRDVEVACIAALALVPLPDDGRGQPDGDAPPTLSRSGEIRLLADTLFGSFQDRIVRAHAATSLARLVDGLPDARRDAWKAELAPGFERLLHPAAPEPGEVVLAAVMAVGELADADGDAHDLRLRNALVRASDELAAETPRLAALAALGRVAGRPGRERLPSPGSAAIENHLLVRLARGGEREKPWAALALGLAGHGLRLDRGPADAAGAPRRAAPEAALRAALRTAGSGYEAGAVALALGLRGDREAGPLLLAALDEPGNATWIPEACLALGLLGYGAAQEPLERLLRDSGARPERLIAAAEALVLLGSPAAVEAPLDLLAAGGSHASRSAALAALARTGDDRAVAPVLALLEPKGAKETTAATRASALRALGAIVERGSLPWQTSYRVARNVEAAPATLHDPLGTGLLTLP